MTDTHKLERCGFLAFLMMLIFGTLFGIIAVVLTHIVIKFYSQYYLMLIFPLLMAWILGFGLAMGAKIGRCTRVNVIAAILVLLFSIVCYGMLLFLNDYYDQQAPSPDTIVDEGLLLVEDGQNFLHKLPYVGDYVPLVENTERESQHLGAALTDFADRFLDLAQAPLVIGNIFDLAIFTPIRDYLIYPGIIDWLAATNADGEQIREHGQLVLSENFASIWMLWSVEFLLVFLIALLKTRKGAKQALKARVKKLQKAGLNIEPNQRKKSAKKKPKEKKKKRAKTSAIDDVEIAPELSGGASSVSVAQEEGEKGKKQKKKKEKKAKPKKEKKGFFSFGRKKETVQEQIESPGTAAGPVEMEFPEDQTMYALILHQYDPSRENDLVQLIQQVGQMPPDKARRLLKVPSLLKRDVSAQDAKFAIDKFNQVQAQVKLITMEQLLEIQKKQQGAQPSQQSTPSAQPKAAPPSPPPAGGPGERYALILKRIEPSRQEAILELLSSLSGRPVDQLQHTLKPPALVLRDATRDEVMMIAQQFQNLQAEVQSVTMAQLQQLIAKSKKQ